VVKPVLMREDLTAEWTPAIIAPSCHVLKFHVTDAGSVSKFAGQRIRVRPCRIAQSQVAIDAFELLGCTGRHLRVHPEDAVKFWPEIIEDGDDVTVCECNLLLD
jgi:hypothetical protein